MSGLQAYRQLRDVLLSFSDDEEQTLGESCIQDCNDEAMICLAKAGEIIRRDMTGVCSQFNCTSFSPGCQEESVPKSLVALVSMILEGPNNI